MSKTDEFAWMDTLPAVRHDGVPAKPLAENPRYKELVSAFRELTPAQRDFVRVMPSVNFVARRANDALRKTGRKVGERSVYRWLTEPSVKRAVELYRTITSEAVGIAAETVVLRIEALAAYCEELVDTLDRDGQPTGQKRMRDVAGAREALKLLAQHVGALKQDEQQTVREGPSLNIVINSPAAPAIDVTPAERRVTVTLPRPE